MRTAAAPWRIKQQGQRGKPFEPSAGRWSPDIARSDLAQVALARKAGEQQPERDGAEQIARGQGEQIGSSCHLG